MTKLGAGPEELAAGRGLVRRASCGSWIGSVRGAVNTSWRVTLRAGLLAAALGSASGLHAATSGATIFTCNDTDGKRVTRDRVIPNCASEQRELNADGSLKRIVPPTLTIDERTEKEAEERAREIERMKLREAVNRDRNLLTRFPNEAAHRKAREAALDDVRNSVKASEARMALLAQERKPLTNEAEFYVGKPLPAKLKQALDANDASTDAQRTLIQNQQVEVARINQLYDVELERLKKLWAGAPLGSIGAPAAGPPRK